MRFGATIQSCSGAWVWLITILVVVSCTDLFLYILHLFNSVPFLIFRKILMSSSSCKLYHKNDRLWLWGSCEHDTELTSLWSQLLTMCFLLLGCVLGNTQGRNAQGPGLLPETWPGQWQTNGDRTKSWCSQNQSGIGTSKPFPSQYPQRCFSPNSEQLGTTEGWEPAQHWAGPARR